MAARASEVDALHHIEWEWVARHHMLAWTATPLRMARNEAVRTATGMPARIRISLMLSYDMAPLDLIALGVRGVSARRGWPASDASRYV